MTSSTTTPHILQHKVPVPGNPGTNPGHVVLRATNPPRDYPCEEVTVVTAEDLQRATGVALRR